MNHVSGPMNRCRKLAGSTFGSIATRLGIPEAGFADISHMLAPECR
jgi:hypothetical protein